MRTNNPNLRKLTMDDIERISLEYLKGWQDLMRYGFRIKGFNSARRKFGLEPLTKEMSDEYRLDYVRCHYSQDDIYQTIREYLKHARVGNTRWTGIELFGCRFGREYARLFKELLGSQTYRKLSEELRLDKSVWSQCAMYGGMGLAGEKAKESAMLTNLERYGVPNVMQDKGIQERLAKTNMEKYGGVSPFCSKEVRAKAVLRKSENMVDAMKFYKETGLVVGNAFSKSPAEFIVMEKLSDRFGLEDVFYSYGIHPSDPRYPFNCDFYIKSEDLFIELNLHYCHGNHWFDASDPADVNRLHQLQSSQSKNSREAARVWSVKDLEKREKARESGIKYLVFWDGADKQIDHIRWPRMLDFYEWADDYGFDYERFVKDHPENTY